MAIREFWNNIRSAARSLSHEVVPSRAVTQVHLPSADLSQADLWLTPRAVAGFKRPDFEFLTDSEQETLQDAVERFRAVAQQVPASAPASAAQVKQARLELFRIHDVLRPDKYGDLNALILGKQLETAIDQTGEKPAWVRGYRFESGQDSIGDKALYV